MISVIHRGGGGGDSVVVQNDYSITKGLVYPNDYNIDEYCTANLSFSASYFSFNQMPQCLHFIKLTL